MQSTVSTPRRQKRTSLPNLVSAVHVQKQKTLHAFLSCELCHGTVHMSHLYAQMFPPQ